MILAPDKHLRRWRGYLGSYWICMPHDEFFVMAAAIATCTGLMITGR
jgi:hypothetical protein